MEHSRQFSEFSKVQKIFQQLLSNVSAVFKTQFSNKSIILQHNFSAVSAILQQIFSKITASFKKIFSNITEPYQRIFITISALFYNLCNLSKRKEVQMNRIFKQIKFIHICLNIHFSHITYLPLPETSLNVLMLLVQFDFFTILKQKYRNL